MSGAAEWGDARDLCRENVALLRAMLGDGRAIPAINDADELALMAEVFRLGSLIVGEWEAEDARRASLRRRPHWAQQGE